MAKQLKVLFLTQYDINGPSSRIRVYQFVPFFEKEGISCTIKPLITGPVKERLKILLQDTKIWPRVKICLYILGRFLLRYRDVLSARHYDIVVVQKDVLPFGLFYLLRLVNSNFIYEFDDAIWETSPDVNKKSLILKLIFWYRRRLFLRLVKKAKVVIAENSYLEQFARQHNQRVEVISAPIDTNKYLPRDTKNDDRIVIGWLGTPMTSYLLDLIKEPLTAVAGEVPNVEFHNIAGSPVEFPGVKVVNIPWSEEKEVEYLSAFDIGVMPLDNTDFNKGRLGYKMLLYASMGLPIVADDVGLNRDVVTDGINGYLVKTTAEWQARLLSLIKQPALREEMGKKARAFTIGKYDLRICVAKYKSILESLDKNKN